MVLLKLRYLIQQSIWFDGGSQLFLERAPIASPDSRRPVKVLLQVISFEDICRIIGHCDNRSELVGHIRLEMLVASDTGIAE